MLLPNEIHPNYQFDIAIKEAKYSAILIALKDKKVQTVCTFPGLSNYKFERQLLQTFPGVKIHCFEKDPKVYEDILESFEKPEGISLINQLAEDFMGVTSTKYDLIFFDYCGGPHEDINNLIDNHLTPQGIFALTEFRGRGHEYPPFNKSGFKQALKPIRYDHMEFTIFQKTTIEKLELGLENIFFQIKRSPKIKTPQIKQPKQLKLNFTQKSIPVIDPVLLTKLPQIEQDILNEYQKGTNQLQLSKIYNMTQSAICFRITRALERIAYLKELPVVTDSEIESVLGKIFWELDIDILKGMNKTTCQTLTADIINSKYGLTADKDKMNQVKIRYRFMKIYKRLETLKDIPEYTPFFKWVTMIQKNPYKLHTVAFPKGHQESVRIASKKTHKKRFYNSSLEVLSSHIDKGMIDLISNVLCTKNFSETAVDLNKSKGNVLNNLYTAHSVQALWNDLHKKLKKVIHMGYSNLTPVLNLMEDCNDSMVQRSKSIPGIKLEGTTDKNSDSLPKMQEVASCAA